MKLSSSFKVGLLTLVALSIFLFTVLWVKGSSFSSAERIEVQFKDVNGMRPGSGIQMMGLRVGQVEEIIPVFRACTQCRADAYGIPGKKSEDHHLGMTPQSHY